jgi:hypothetical protein
MSANPTHLLKFKDKYKRNLVSRFIVKAVKLHPLRSCSMKRDEDCVRQYSSSLFFKQMIIRP